MMVKNPFLMLVHNIGGITLSLYLTCLTLGSLLLTREFEREKE